MIAALTFYKVSLLFDLPGGLPQTEPAKLAAARHLSKDAFVTK
jgi:hypothetical protein